jgi:hypothetical protein
MTKVRSGAAASAALLAVAAAAPAHAEMFNRIATFHVVDNLPADADPEAGTVAEIVAATPDGMTLIYTDSPGKRIGFVDITDPKSPKASGVAALDGEPTSVVVAGSNALVGVVTSESYDKPSGHVAVVNVATKAVVATCDLGGQPDSVAKSADGRYLAVVIENERDEEVNDGAIPQLPGGNLTILPLVDGAPDCAAKVVVDLVGLAAVAPEDPEPELVDINAANQAVVTLQENNHIAIVDLLTGKVTANFSAGTVDLAGIDTEKDKVISLGGSMSGVAREPDSVQWIGDDRFVTANEGDYEGGSRGFTIFKADGTVDYESGPDFEHIVVRLGHYPEARNKKGNEPEGAEVATFGDDRLIFIASERGSLVGVYKDEGEGKAPAFLQALPGGIGPEGLLAIPERNLFVTASETDLRADGLIGSVVTVYERSDKPAAYPTLVSANDAASLPIAWAAISGAVADAATPGKLHAVTDSAFAEARILTIEATKSPAVITEAITVTRDGAPVKLLDLEGIALANGGGFWLASEGNPEREENPTQSTLVKVDASGAVVEEIALPEALQKVASRFGFEGVAVTGSGADETVWLAVQREWKDDPAGKVKILAYRPADKHWGVVHYPLDPAGKGWIGLSEITAAGDGFVIVERDNQVGRDAHVKKLTHVSVKDVTPAEIGVAEIPVLKKTDLRDLVPDLAAPGGFILDKVESFAVDADGNAFVITDNDGVDDHSGETQFLSLGKLGMPM